MSNYPIATCMFQKYIMWERQDCSHPKRIKDIKCDKDVDCSHRELRRICELARIYHESNQQKINIGRVIYCSQYEDCKYRHKGKYPECQLETIEEWAEMYKKDFEVK